MQNRRDQRFHNMRTSETDIKVKKPTRRKTREFLQSTNSKQASSIELEVYSDAEYMTANFIINQKL